MKALGRWLAMVCVSLLALQLFFVGRIALMAAVDPQSTSFQRSEQWRLVREKGRLPWSQQWVLYSALSDHLKRAVIASEDGDFIHHHGVQWAAIEGAWKKNTLAEEKAQRRIAVPGARGPVQAPRVKIVGGSTITQQLAKNLLLTGERSLLRKGQELVLALALELFMPKQRILELYLNNVEWGEGVFGAQAAAQHYFHKNAAQLSAYEAARLVVMLPAPKRYEKMPNSAYLSGRASTIVARMGDAELP